MERTFYNIGGYRFNDWSLVKELYVPADADSSTKTLKDRSKSELLDHLQYYAVPYGSLFIAFRALNVQLTTVESIAIFGTSGRYPAGTAPPAWVAGFAYVAGTHLIKHGATDRLYRCIVSHTSAEDIYEPGKGTHWSDKWKEGEDWQEAWESGFNYLYNQFVQNEGSGYRCTADHEANGDNCPCSGGDWANYWAVGDEMQADIAISRQNFNISKGIVLPFGVDIVGVFSGNTAGGRWIGAKASTGTLKAGATIFGIEVDA